jgi:hypothetical protein
MANSTCPLSPRVYARLQACMLHSINTLQCTLLECIVHYTADGPSSVLPASLSIPTVTLQAVLLVAEAGKLAFCGRRFERPGYCIPQPRRLHHVPRRLREELFRVHGRCIRFAVL